MTGFLKYKAKWPGGVWDNAVCSVVGLWQLFGMQIAGPVSNECDFFCCQAGWMLVLCVCVWQKMMDANNKVRFWESAICSFFLEAACAVLWLQPLPHDRKMRLRKICWKLLAGLVFTAKMRKCTTGVLRHEFCNSRVQCWEMPKISYVVWPVVVSRQNF